MHKLLLLICLLAASCSEKPFHTAAPDDIHTHIINGMRSTYQAIGKDADIVDRKKHRSLAYQLALHVKSEDEKLAHIIAGNDTDKHVRHYARSSIALVQKQKPGYPIVPMFDALFGLSKLDTDQEILLLACTAKLLAESEVVASKPSLQR